MKVSSLSIPDIKLIEPKVFEDERGFFFESFNHAEFEEAIGQQVNFVQDNHSKSIKGVLRGIHFQSDNPQGKLIRVVSGEVYDVAVDIRQKSPTYGKWVAETISAENRRQMWIPEGFAHGFMVLSEYADLLYKTTDYYHPASEKCIRWDDSNLLIDWPLGENLIISSKDRAGKAFEELFGKL